MCQNSQIRVAIDVNTIIVTWDSDTTEIVQDDDFKSLMQDQENALYKSKDQSWSQSTN